MLISITILPAIKLEWGLRRWCLVQEEIAQGASLIASFQRPRSGCLLGMALFLDGCIQKNAYLGRREGVPVSNLIVMCYWCMY